MNNKVFCFFLFVIKEKPHHKDEVYNQINKLLIN